MKPDFPYPYYFYGSKDSLDADVLIEISKDMMPAEQEDRKRLIKSIEQEYDLSWNANLIVVENGIITDTIYPKTWIDSLNNSLYSTYDNHKDKQVFPLPINRMVPRNKLLAIYKTVRTILSMLSRTHYRSTVKPILNGIHPFNLKIDAWRKIDLTTIDNFNQDNTSDVDAWKIIAFYLGQNISLIKYNLEIYTKIDLYVNHPLLKSFIYREEITQKDKQYLSQLIVYYLDEIVIPFGEYHFDKNIMICNDEKIDMKKEIWL
jgi:hypothetical protein